MSSSQSRKAPEDFALSLLMSHLLTLSAIFPLCVKMLKSHTFLLEADFNSVLQLKLKSQPVLSFCKNPNLENHWKSMKNYSKRSNPTILTCDLFYFMKFYPLFLSIYHHIINFK